MTRIPRLRSVSLVRRAAPLDRRASSPRSSQPSRRGSCAIAAVLLGACLLLPARPAGATFHFAHIERVMTGVGGTTGVQFVEIVMDAAGQNLVSGSKLIAFDAGGTFSHVVLTLDHNVTGGNDRPFLMASAGFAAEAGITPDFVFDSTGANALPPTDGMVCWGKPSDPTDPNDFDMIDCVSYGDFTGEPNRHTSAPSSISPFGHGIVRTSSTGSSADDFACEDPSTPRNNALSTGSIDASTPCSGCGNGAVEEPETCDDGDTTFVPGDSCSGECSLLPCGVPTNGAAVPKTSDALFVLKAAVQSSNCDVLVCDVNDSGTVTTADALLILKKAVGQAVALHCPP